MSDITQLDELKPKIPIKINSLVGAFNYLFSPTYEFNGERHVYWEVVGVFDSCARIVSDSTELFLHTNEFYIHRPMEFHAIYPHKQSLHVGIFAFTSDSEDLYSIADKVILSPDLMNLYSSILLEGSQALAGINSVPPLDSTNSPPFAADQTTKILAEFFLINLIRAFSPSRKTDAKIILNTPLETTVSQRIIDYLQVHVYDNISLPDLSSHFGYSKEYLCRTFKKETGKSIIDYYAYIKIEKAKQLLASKKYTVYDVYRKLDYCSPQYFARQFKKITGITPSRFLKSIQRSHWQNWNPEYSP